MSKSVGTTFSTKLSTSGEDGRYIVAEVGIFFHGLRPKGYMDSCRPSVESMKERCSCAFGYIAYATFGLPILVMRIDAAEGESLISG